jgi:hypothetical protein
VQGFFKINFVFLAVVVFFRLHADSSHLAGNYHARLVDFFLFAHGFIVAQIFLFGQVFFTKKRNYFYCKVGTGLAIGCCCKSLICKGLQRRRGRWRKSLIIKYLHKRFLAGFVPSIAQKVFYYKNQD